jgi:hypothetical protein
MKLWPSRKPLSLVKPWVITTDACRQLDNLVSADSSQYQCEAAWLIIPRQYLFYLFLDLTLVPHAQRSALIQQRLVQISPFAAPKCWIVREADSAQIWFWDSKLVETRRSNLLEVPAAVVPETLMYQPQVQGFFLQPCLDGWEMQYWELQGLRNSRWVPLKPNVEEKADFVRACGYSLTDLFWSESEPALLSRPWNEKPFWSKETFLRERVVTQLISGLLLAWITLQLGLGMGTLIKEQYLQSLVDTKSGTMTELVDQRDLALRQQEFNRMASELTSAPSQLFLAAQVTECLAKFDFVILDWQYQRGQLALLLEKEGLDTRGLIESCSANPVFSDVRVEPGITPQQTRVLFSLPVAEKQGVTDV